MQPDVTNVSPVDSYNTNLARALAAIWYVAFHILVNLGLLFVHIVDLCKLLFVESLLVGYLL